MKHSALMVNQHSAMLTLEFLITLRCPCSKVLVYTALMVWSGEAEVQVTLKDSQPGSKKNLTSMIGRNWNGRTFMCTSKLWLHGMVGPKPRGATVGHVSMWEGSKSPK